MPGKIRATMGPNLLGGSFQFMKNTAKDNASLSSGTYTPPTNAISNNNNVTVQTTTSGLRPVNAGIDNSLPNTTHSTTTSNSSSAFTASNEEILARLRNLGSIPSNTPIIVGPHATDISQTNTTHSTTRPKSDSTEDYLSDNSDDSLDDADINVQDSAVYTRSSPSIKDLLIEAGLWEG